VWISAISILFNTYWSPAKMGFPENEPSISQILVKRRTRVCNQFARKAKLKIPILQKKKWLQFISTSMYYQLYWTWKTNTDNRNTIFDTIQTGIINEKWWFLHLYTYKTFLRSHFAAKDAASLKSSSPPAIADNCNGRGIKGWKGTRDVVYRSADQFGAEWKLA